MIKLKITGKKVISVLLSVIFIVLAFCGCSGGSESETTTTETTTETTTQTTTESSNPFDYLDTSFDSKDEIFEKMLKYYEDNTDANIDEWEVVSDTDTVYIAQKDTSQSYPNNTAMNNNAMVCIGINNNFKTQISYDTDGMSGIILTIDDGISEICNFLNCLIPDCPSEYKFNEQYFDDKVNDTDTNYYSGNYQWSDNGANFTYQASANALLISF